MGTITELSFAQGKRRLQIMSAPGRIDLRPADAVDWSPSAVQHSGRSHQQHPPDAPRCLLFAMGGAAAGRQLTHWE